MREDSPLPRSFNVAVERAFMKHSFTLTSVGEAGGTKRFMLSFEDGERVARWTHVIREQVAAAERRAHARVRWLQPGLCRWPRSRFCARR